MHYSEASKNPVPLTLFISTDLNSLIAASRDKDIVHEGKVYRELVPQYFAWLHIRMRIAQTAHREKRLPDAQWDVLRERFNPIQEKAIDMFGKDVLKKACADFDPNRYLPPQSLPEEAWIYPNDDALQHHASVEFRAVVKVDAIRKKAMKLGWTEAQLYQNQGCLRFPCGEDYGLVCFVGGDREIGRISESTIEILHNPGRQNEKVLHFHNMRVAQPWMKYVEAPDGN